MYQKSGPKTKKNVLMVNCLDNSVRVLFCNIVQKKFVVNVFK